MPERQPADEVRLITDAQNGDVEAFGELYERYAPLVFRFLFSHLEHRLDAEDLTEDVFLKVWGSLSGYRLQGVPFSAFLFRVARNALIDHYRRNRRQGFHQPLEDDGPAEPDQDPGWEVPVEMERQQVRRLLGQLREDYRTVLELRFLVGLSPEEAAFVMRRSPGALRVLQHRALLALRALVSKSE